MSTTGNTTFYFTNNTHPFISRFTISKSHRCRLGIVLVNKPLNKKKKKKPPKKCARIIGEMNHHQKAASLEQETATATTNKQTKQSQIQLQLQFRNPCVFRVFFICRLYTYTYFNISPNAPHSSFVGCKDQQRQPLVSLPERLLPRTN